MRTLASLPITLDWRTSPLARPKRADAQAQLAYDIAVAENFHSFADDLSLAALTENVAVAGFDEQLTNALAAADVKYAVAMKPHFEAYGQALNAAAVASAEEGALQSLYTSDPQARAEITAYSSAKVTAAMQTSAARSFGLPDSASNDLRAAIKRSKLTLLKEPNITCYCGLFSE